MQTPGFIINSKSTLSFAIALVISYSGKIVVTIFNLPKEKEDRKGNIKTDFSIGIEGEMLGGTANIGYDTKGHNIRGGLGVRIIF